MELKIIFAGNNTLIGRYEEDILYEPRAVVFGVDPQGRPIMGIQPLVGLPDLVRILNPSLMYDVKDSQIVNLYIEATTGISVAKDLNNVRSIRS